jgi:hypothetical protein
MRRVFSSNITWVKTKPAESSDISPYPSRNQQEREPNTFSQLYLGLGNLRWKWRWPQINLAGARLEKNTFQDVNFWVQPDSGEVKRKQLNELETAIRSANGGADLRSLSPSPIRGDLLRQQPCTLTVKPATRRTESRTDMTNVHRRCKRDHHSERTPVQVWYVVITVLLVL